MYLLNTCAACAAPLALDAPRCVRCHSRYCNAAYAVVIGLRWRYGEALYRNHFFGHDGYRTDLVEAIFTLSSAASQSIGVLGEQHPTTGALIKSAKRAFDEQLDWTLDDFPEHIRALYGSCSEIVRLHYS
jgi:hypothetical protein